MDQKTAIVLEVVKGDKKFSFIMPSGCHYGEAYDAAFAILNEVMDMGKNAVEEVKPKEMDKEEVEKSIEKANK